jgi:serine/threonine protein kinase
MDKYDLLQQIGDGTFGSVAKGVHKKSGQLVAVKRMKQKYYTWDECIKLPEVQVLRKLQVHPNVIKLREVVRENNELFFVFEFMDGDLLGVIRKCKQNMPPAQALTAPAVPYHKVKSYMFQLMQSLAYIHKNGYFHRDLKPENLLIRKDPLQNQEIVKLADFGLVKEVRARPPYTDYVSTRWYRAPELLLQDRNYTCAVDVWAAGCIFSELITTKPLFPGNNEVDQLFKIMSVFGSPTEASWADGMNLARKIRYQFPIIAPTPLRSVLPTHMPPNALDLLSKMLVYDPKKRITAQQCLAHPYFNVGLDEEPLSAYCGSNAARPAGGAQSAPTVAPVAGQNMHTPVQWRQPAQDVMKDAASANKAGLQLQQQQQLYQGSGVNPAPRPASGSRPMFPPVEISKHHVTNHPTPQQQQQQRDSSTMSRYYLVPSGLSPKQRDEVAGTNAYGSPPPNMVGSGTVSTKPFVQMSSPPQRPPTKLVMPLPASSTEPSTEGLRPVQKPTLQPKKGINLDELLEEFEVEMAGMGFQTKKEAKSSHSPVPSSGANLIAPHRASPSPTMQQQQTKPKLGPSTSSSNVGVKGLLPTSAAQLQSNANYYGSSDQASPIQKLLQSTRYKPSSSFQGSSPLKDPPTPTFLQDPSIMKPGAAPPVSSLTHAINSPSAVTAANRYDLDSTSFASLDVGGAAAAGHLGGSTKKVILGHATVSPSVNTLLSRQAFKPAQLPQSTQGANDDDDMPAWLRMVNERGQGNSRTTPTFGKAPLNPPRR